MDAAAMPLPRDETTPPVTKMNLVSPGFIFRGLPLALAQPAPRV